MIKQGCLRIFMKRIYFLIIVTTTANLFSMDNFTVSEIYIHYQTHDGTSRLFKDNNEKRAIEQCLEFAAERTKLDHKQLPIFDKLQSWTELNYPTKAPEILAEFSPNVAKARLLSLLDKYRPVK